MGNKAYKARMMASKLCVDCGKPVYGLLTHCLDHVKSRYDYNSFYYIKNKSKRCEYFHNNRRKRVKEGRCKDCGLPLTEDVDDSFLRCINCREHLHKPRRWRLLSAAHNENSSQGL